MKILVFSDSHGMTDNMETALDEHRGAFDAVIHLGDGAGDLKRCALPEGARVIAVAGNYEDFFSAYVPHDYLPEVTAELGGVKVLCVHGHRYGTLKSEVYDRMEKGQNVLLDIDPQGAREVMSKEKDCVSVFILPPSYHDLKVRLHTRNTENEEEIQRRLNNARGEIRQTDRYRYLIVNDNLELAFEQLVAIVRAEKQNTVRYFPVIEE